MRSSLNRGIIAKALMTVATAALLAGCSNSIERFQSAYDNPSDADPVYTASVRQTKKKYAKPALKRPSYEEPSYEASADDVIEETPIKRAAIPLANKPKDYASAYKPNYKQPSLKKPKLVPPPEDVAETVEEETVAPVAIKAPFKKAQAAKPKLIEPPVDDVAYVEPAKPKKKIKFNASAPTLAEEEVADVAPVLKKSGVGAQHTVESGDTLYALGRKYGVSPFAIAEANGLDTNQQLALGQKVKIPGSRSIQPKLVEAPAVEETVAEAETTPKPAKLKKKAPLSLTEDEQVAANDADTESAIGETPKQVVAEAKPKLKEQPVAEAPMASPAGLNLRWPLKGKVISGYGNKPGGLKNEGINISVPEGTSIRAADTGVVAYAGNELKGYGNLVLIRHAGGYVTAYAHAKELLVKRGDKIERGAIIGKAGQTGSVSSPQLHFEVRKGATALDPMKYMSSTTASN
jgi:murein DD-endopeptidase MepM/ murein hydrolase activator NlpD